jgi:exodeoxyribonuclease VIII
MTDTAESLPELFADGVYYGLPAEAYHAHEAMSASGAKKILRSPMHYKLMRETPSEPTAAMEFGTAVHCGVLEPERYDSCVVRADFASKRGKAYDEFAAQHQGQIILLTDEHDRAASCIAAVRASPAGRRLLQGAKTEVSLFWQDKQYNVPCKARLDAISLGGVSDVKTAKDAGPDEFSRACATFSYHLPGAHYLNGYEAVLNETPEFFAMIVVESEPPHAVAVYELGRASIVYGLRQMDEAMSRYRDAVAKGKWEGYGDKIITIDLPKWAIKL